MNKFVLLVIATFVVFSLYVTEAEARRFGGGSSLGRQMSITPRAPISPRTATPQAHSSGAMTAAQGAARPSGISRWLGPLAGLAAGGLLASLFFGGAFHGLQPMDFLLLGGVIIGGLLLFRLMRGRNAQPQPAEVGAYDRDAPHYVPEAATHYPPEGSPGWAVEARPGEAPTWFEQTTFATDAKTHFIRLQAAWDKGDFRDIRDYTSPELFAELQREYDRLGRQNQYTEVLTLNAEVLETRRDADQLLVSVLFTGLIREQQDAEADDVSEIWHVTHDWSGPEGQWIIVGIQQTKQ